MKKINKKLAQTMQLTLNSAAFLNYLKVNFKGTYKKYLQIKAETLNPVTDLEGYTIAIAEISKAFEVFTAFTN